MTALEAFTLDGKIALVTGASRGLGDLASSASDYVHGHVLVVDGGWMGR
jgi:NAD(P)-dependent dehydrogenase (short-subunit alcohol dehydrogenase family)